MLKVDLALLERQHRLRVDEDVPADAPLWEGSGVRLAGPLQVRLEAQQVGHDVVVRGRLEGEAALECRRCLKDVRVPVSEEVATLFREGVDPVEAEAEEIYALPARGRELDLTDFVREQALLAVPTLTICTESCKGLCPKCGVNLNERDCDCAEEVVDDRWAALRKLKTD